MRKFKKFEIVLLFFVLSSFYFTWTRNLNISYDQIPSVINGLVASISMIVGFSGAIMIFTLTKQWENLRLGMTRPVIYLILIGLPLGLLWTTYNQLLDGNFFSAINIAMSDLAIASAILLDIIAYYARETVLHMQKQTKIDETSGELRV